jgi:hypothetical protein
MALTAVPTPPAEPTLLQLQTELTVIRAQHNDMALKVRRHELLDRARYEIHLAQLARRVRDQLLTASSRHAAILAADAGVDAAALGRALDRIMRATLTDLSARHGVQ